MPQIPSGVESQKRQVTDEMLEAMSAAAFLRYLRSLEIELRAKEGKLGLSAPAGVVTARLQAMIRNRKAELLAELEAQAAAEEQVAPLTFAQQRLWLVERFAPDTAAYNIPQAWPVEGEVEEQAFRSALQALAQRHAALRTRIELRNGEPVQVIVRKAEIPLAIVDLRGIEDASEAEAAVQRHLVSAGREPFALDHAPLIRFQLFRLPKQRSLVAYDVHHIVADQRSLDVLKRDLAALYLGAVQGVAPELPALSLSYAEVAEREHSGLTTELHEGQMAYWRKRLEGMPTLLELPFSKSNAEQQSYAGSTLRMAIGEELTQSLRALAARSSTSLYMTMLSAFAVLLHRYTGQSDLCVGTPLTGRKRREEEDVIGLFINMLPLRCRLDGELSFRETTRTLSQQVLEDFEQGDVPFQKLVMELHPHRSMAHSPLFQVMFALTPKDAHGDEAQEETFLSISKFDLTLQIAERTRGMDCYLEYRTDLFAEADIEALGKHYIALLEAIVSGPERSIDRLPLITRGDEALFAKWNATELEFDRSMTLADLFAMQARATPDADAVLWKESAIGYRELNEQAEELAAVLRSMGAGPESFVGVCLERTPTLIAALLAIHKTGAAYLPLDPKYPIDRLKYMLEDSGARLLVAQRAELAETLAAHCPAVQLVVPESKGGKDANESQIAARPENAAYLIYTSGSTGKPKGVVVEHRNAVALLAWARSYLKPEAYRGMLASTSVCFDLSIFEIFLPLTTGNTVVLVDDVLALASAPKAELVTLVNTVPSAMNALLQAGLPKSVTTVCLAGEFLPAELVDRIYEEGVHEVFDLYGPTETTTYSTCVLRKSGEPANLGGPLGNTQIHLLDDRQQLVPAGVPGEIYIGGEGVTRGYLGRPELTEERFVRLPQVDAHGRLYRTGDLARRRHDGALIFMGRRDNQVKLRGHRIELGEVESALREASGVTEVAVVVRKSGDTLAAYVETSGGGAREWMEALRKRLPAYMIPATITEVQVLPRTPNGKIDRQALRERAEAGEEDLQHDDESPNDLLEQWLANIWSKKLGVSPVTRNAHFFERLGGHSLAAFEIFAEIEAKTGMAMMLATLFQAPTVAQLAAAMRRQGWRDPGVIQMLRTHASGASIGRVVYGVGKIDDAKMERWSREGVRVMQVKSLEDVAAQANAIANFELTRPELIFAADGAERDRMAQLREALMRAGWPAASIRSAE